MKINTEVEYKLGISVREIALIARVSKLNSNRIDFRLFATKIGFGLLFSQRRK